MMREAAEVAAARAALGRVLHSPADALRARFEALVGGTHRRSWLVILADGRRAALRMPLAHSSALLDVVTEARAMDAAAAAGLAPAVIAADAESGVLLTEYGPGVPWSAADVRAAENMRRLVLALRTLHALPTELPPFAAERIASRYLADLPADVRASRTATRWSEELLLFARRYDARLAPTAFCHNDLAAANILDDGRLVLVDFEYAARADPLLDLANVVVMNALDAGEQSNLLALYREGAPTADDLAELTWVARMVRLMAWFWAVLGASRAEDPSLYAPYVASLAAELKAQTGET